jgi:hypothetical protein
MTEHPEPGSEPHRSSPPSGVALGAILIIVGAILFAGQLGNFGLGDLGWPVWIVAAGIAILLVGLFLVPESGTVVGGTIVTTVGLVLAYQNATGLWATWAYAWALVGPAASGLGLAIWGIRRADPNRIRSGIWGLLGGLAMFAIGFLFFEGVIGLTGQRIAIPEWAIPAALIAIGVVVLLRGVLQRREPQPS